MGTLAASSDNSAAATRGQIVQRVLVDGWSAAQAAAAFEVGERQVVRWVAAYRRHGMASLRDDLAAQPAPWRWLRRLHLGLRRMGAARGDAPPSAELAPFVRSRHRTARRSQV
jgi:hypothetical protein